MVSKVLHITCIALLVALAVLLLVNAIRALNSGYECLEFKVTHIYTNHSTGKSDVSLQSTVDNKLIVPVNKLSTGKKYEVGETINVWYNPETNMVVQHFMTNVVMNFVSAGLAVACIAVTFPRKKKIITGG